MYTARTIKLVILFTTLVGCTNFSTSANKMFGYGVVSTQTDSFDNSTTVTATPSFLVESPSKWVLNDFMLGARWNSSSPDSVQLDLLYKSSVNGGGYVSFRGLDINLNGEIQKFKTIGYTTLTDSGYVSGPNTIYTESENSVAIPLKLLVQMSDPANSCKLRIYSSDGYEDATFSVAKAKNGSATALISLREFLDLVNPARSEI